MFTDSEATPARVEMLLDVVRSMSGRKLDAATLKQLLQPTGLPGLKANSDQTRAILLAAKDLELVEEQADGSLRASRSRDPRPARIAVVEAIDEKVLARDDVEPWFALFYAYLLGRDASAAAGEAGSRWEASFNADLYPGVKPDNRFNISKYRGLRRWFRYSGLGWHDGDNRFHPNPYERVLRQLPLIFEKAPELSIDDFMERLAKRCPELDGGFLFLKANDWSASNRSLSMGLSHALIDLHLDGALTLNCPIDSDGWSLSKASPPRDGVDLKSDRVSSVRFSAQKGTVRP